LGRSNFQLGLLGQHGLLGDIEFRIGRNAALTSDSVRLKLAPDNLQGTFSLGQVGPRDCQIGPGLGHSLDIFVIIQFRHDLSQIDRVGNVHGDMFDAAADFGCHHKFSLGFQRSAEGSPQRNRPLFDGGDFHRHRASCFPGAGSVSAVLGAAPQQPARTGRREN
jgi:hypothetical protein